MLVFATEFTTGPNATAESFLDVCQKWLVGSPRYPWEDGDFSHSHSVNEIQKIKKDAFQVSIAFTDSGGSRMTAMQHRYADNKNLEWVTELVGSENNGSFLVSVRVHCTSLVTGVEIPWARKPYIIRQILERFGGGIDGGLTTGEFPHFLAEEDLNLAAAAMTDQLGNRLPIVYVSSGMNGKPELNVRELAKWLSGMAHVVVEPSREFSYRLMPLVDQVNAYGGAIGIYWPDGARFEKTFVGSRGPDATARFIESRVQNALCQSQPTDLSTWMAVRALVANKRLRALRESGTEDINEWIEAFDEERKSLQAQLEEAKTQIHSLSAQLRGIRSSEGTGGLLPAGTEQDLFPGERSEVVQEALRDALSKAEAGSRAQHVLQDLVGEEYVQMRGRLAESVKSTLHDKMNIGATEIAELKQLGFSITEDGKHYKAVFRGDPRYTFTLHKTASDYRAPKNLVSTINRKLFN